MAKSKFTERVPEKEYLLDIGTYFLTAGGTQMYKVYGGPICRIYWQRYDDKDLSNHMRETLTWGEDPQGNKVSATPWKTESGWVCITNPETGEEKWQKPKSNFPSYEVQYVENDGTESQFITQVTLRWIPKSSTDKNQLLQEMAQCRAALSSQEIRPALLPPSIELTHALARIQDYVKTCHSKLPGCTEDLMASRL